MGEESSIKPASSRLLDLAPELLQQVLAYLNPYDLISFGRTSHFASTTISPLNQLLWRSSFLQIFDDPREAWAELLPTARAQNAKRESEWNWHTEVVDRIRALHSVSSSDIEEKRTNYNRYASTLLDVIETARPVPKDQHHKIPTNCLNVRYLQSIFDLPAQCEPFIHDFCPDRNCPALSMQPGSFNTTNFINFNYQPGRPTTRSMMSRQVVSEPSSRLHILYGLTQREKTSGAAKGAARSLVYDWNQTGSEADFGPYQRDGSGHVNWEILEAIHSVIVRNFELVTRNRVPYPQGFAFNVPSRAAPAALTRSPSPSPSSGEEGEDEVYDWAGVTGHWIGTYSFLDYTDLFHYNIGYRPGPQPPLDDHVEACGDLMRLTLAINSANVPPDVDDEKWRTELPTCEDLPILYFSGLSQSHENPMHGMAIAVRGFAAMIPGGKEVRWRFVISYAGEDQWHLEGVQPGGIRTGGIFGLWSHCDHEENGPVGPFCYYPLDDCLPDH